MKSKAVLAALAILVVFPAVLSAQQTGFIVGLGSGYTHQHVYPGITGYPGVVGYPVITGPTVITTARRSVGFIAPRAHQLPRATIVPQGSVFLVGSRAVNAARRHEPRTPTHSVIAPGFGLVTPGNIGVVPGGYYGMFSNAHSAGSWGLWRIAL